MGEKKKLIVKEVPWKYPNGGFDLDSDAANADWIRAARLRKAGKEDELRKLEKQHMYFVSQEDGEDVFD